MAGMKKKNICAHRCEFIEEMKEIMGGHSVTHCLIRLWIYGKRDSSVCFCRERLTREVLRENGSVKR